MQPDELECDAMTPGWEQHDEQQEPWLRHRIAEVCELVCKCGGCPQDAHLYERALLTAAKLNTSTGGFGPQGH
jgi:hypothetical protein